MPTVTVDIREASRPLPRRQLPSVSAAQLITPVHEEQPHEPLEQAIVCLSLDSLESPS
jgi:hypothetical protein